VKGECKIHKIALLIWRKNTEKTNNKKMPKLILTARMEGTRKERGRQQKSWRG
jgi:hypothetical protein